MKLKRHPELHAFLSTHIMDAEPGTDEKATRSFLETATADRRRQVLAQAKQLLADGEFPLDEIGSEANRWFGENEEARAWLQEIVDALESAQQTEGGATGLVVKDSNGTPLAEGDSVTVIKDLKVKGGSSDLKRGTTIRKIHLVDDPEVIECRVDGSTLVLKTCFLKKA